jgi:hypothetical protein
MRTTENSARVAWRHVVARNHARVIVAWQTTEPVDAVAVNLRALGQ